ncbi:ABC transporter ATP-binding protein [Thalassomonas viridans]|uniref:ABC transporter ATP-binding protein n=2 Tax=Thalassomonas viridans TaxID=137584 RepID=A0AAE9Z7E2_9GAMM|nr:ABC transporter ATP-binding protein [Thalassomonas viridans]WDE08141.1 ABC transporter ATP-binding protein [Thalassomonas viridans]
MPLTINNLNHQIHDGHLQRWLLTRISLEIAPGECVALTGDSGSGKTTLLNLIAALEPLQQGEIYVSGQPLHRATDKERSRLRKQTLAIIFQHYNLLSCLNVLDNIGFSARLAGRYDESHSLSLAKHLGIDHLLEHYPDTLSGGEMQRVAIARALSARPKLLLADEPTGNLDNRNSDQVVKLLLSLAKSHHSALLMVTHSSAIAEKMDKVYQLKDGCLSRRLLGEQNG